MIEFYIWYKTEDFVKNSVRIDSDYADALNLFRNHIGEDFPKIIEVEVCTTREYISLAVDLEFAIMTEVKNEGFCHDLHS